MREDMYKLITECYRVGGNCDYKKIRRRRNQQLKIAEINDDFDLLDTKESMRRPYIEGWNNKEFGENLPPLRRFLESCAGRLWSEVHSEMASYINCNSEAQRHVWLHAVDYVEEKTFMGDDGKVWYNCGYTWGWKRDGLYRPISESWAVVYVHPETGRLVKNNYQPRWKRNKQTKKPIPRVIVDDFTQCHMIWGDWYLIELAIIPRPYWKPWSQKHRDNLLEAIKEAKEEIRWKTGYRASDMVDNEGRWIFPCYKDVATEDICRSLRIGYQEKRFGVPVYENAGSIYGYSNVYAKSRKQMNTQELRRYGIKKVPGKEGEFFRK